MTLSMTLYSKEFFIFFKLLCTIKNVILYFFFLYVNESSNIFVLFLLFIHRCKIKMKIKRSKSLSPEPSSSRDTKRVKLEETTNLNRTSSANILEFSDDVLLNILKYLYPQDLMAVSL